MIKFEFTSEETNTILKALGYLPHRESRQLIDNIKASADAQIKKSFIEAENEIIQKYLSGAEADGQKNESGKVKPGQ
jgi:hypothetical protein